MVDGSFVARNREFPRLQFAAGLHHGLHQADPGQFPQRDRPRAPSPVFANAMQTGGFATDSNYASKIIMISQSPMMEQMLQAVGADDAPAD